HVLMIGFLGPERVLNMRGFQARVAVVDVEIEKLIAARRGAPDLAEREDILSLLLQARDESGQGLSDGELRDELVTLLVGGHETPAARTPWPPPPPPRAPPPQARLATPPDEYFDAVLTEPPRLPPPAALALRRLRVPLTIAGHRLPADATVAPS